MSYNKFLSMMIILFLSIGYKNSMLAQVNIQEKVILNPKLYLPDESSTEGEYNPLQLVLLGGRDYTYSLTGPGGSISGSGAEGEVIIESIKAINGEYTITITSSCECITSVGWSVTWLDQYGQNKWVSGYQMWFHDPGTKSHTFAFNRPPDPPTEPCDFDFQLSAYELCDTSQYVSIEMELLSNVNCITNPDITLSVQSNLADVIIFNENTQQNCGTSVSIKASVLDQYKIKLRSRYYGDEPDEVSVNIATKNLSKTNSLSVPTFNDLLFFTTELYYSNMAVPGSMTEINALTRSEHCYGIYQNLPPEIKYKAEITKGQNCGTLLHADDETLQGNVLENLSHNDGLLRLFFIANDNLSEVPDKVIIKISTTDPQIESCEATIILDFGHGLVIDFSPPVIGIWEQSSIQIRERKSDGQIVDFPSDQLFNIRITEGEDFGVLYSEPADLYSREFENVTLQGLFFLSDDTIEDTTRVKIYAETYVEADSGGLSCSIQELNVNTSPSEIKENRNVNELKKISVHGEILIVKSGAKLKVEFDKNPIAPGDTANIIIEGLDNSGNPINFPPNQIFYLSLGDGNTYADLYSTATGQSDVYLDGRLNEFQIIAKDTIETDSVFVDVFVATTYETDGVLARILTTDPVNTSISPDRLIRMSIQNKRVNKVFPQLTNKNNSGINYDKNSTSSNETIFGVGRLMIKKEGNCSDAPQCEGDPVPLEFVIKENPNDGLLTKGKNLCPPPTNNGSVNGITAPIPTILQSQIAKIMELCYNTNRDQWQCNFGTITYDFVLDLCWDNIGFNEDHFEFHYVNSINEIPDNDICNAIQDLNDFKQYANPLRRGAYILYELLWKHERSHKRDFKEKYEKAFQEFNNRIKEEFKPTCSEISNLSEIESAARFNVTKIFSEEYEYIEEQHNKESGNDPEDPILKQKWEQKEIHSKIIPDINEIIKLLKEKQPGCNKK